ncbi:MAG: condensation domain-containing protein, partial [Acinetobacter johnsonii]
EEVAQFMSQDFDLKNGPLARCLLIKEHDNRYLWLTVLHHLITDGQSANQFLHDVMTHYVHKTQPAHTKSYQEYIHWQRDHYFHRQVPELLDEWQIKLTDTPVDVPITQDTGLAQAALVINQTIPIEVLSKTQTILASNAVTTSNYLLMTLSQMLMTTFNRRKQGIVMFYSGRESGEFTDVFGDLSNDVVICLEQENNSPIAVLKELQQQIMTLTEQQYFRIQLLKDCQLLPEISFDYQNIDKIVYADEHFSAVQTSFHNVQPFLWGTEPRVLSFKALESEGSLCLSLKYRSDKITEACAQKLLADWVTLITEPLVITPQSKEHKAVIAEDKASVLQQNLWSLLSNTKEHGPYTIPQIKILAPNCDVDLLEQALNQCIATHAALRTQFVIHNERLNYVIKEHAQCTIRVIETDNL